MQFGAFEEIKEVGYRHGETFFKVIHQDYSFSVFFNYPTHLINGDMYILRGEGSRF